jgi:hypothetical protein
MFISCWTAIHLNIPSPNSQQWRRFFNRTIYLLLTAITPEVILAVAIRDYLDAKACVKRLRPDFGNGSKGWSIVHEFYIYISGFYVRYRKGYNAEMIDRWLSAVDIEDHVKRGILEDVMCRESNSTSPHHPVRDQHSHIRPICAPRFVVLVR